jgi:hypothetical protein
MLVPRYCKVKDFSCATRQRCIGLAQSACVSWIIVLYMYVGPKQVVDTLEIDE